MVKISETNKKMNLLTLPGDGIGPEIVRQAIKIIKALSPDFTIDSAPIGGAGYDADGDPLPKTTLDKAVKADAILMGSVGDWKYDKLPREKRPTRFNNPTTSRVAWRYITRSKRSCILEPSHVSRDLYTMLCSD